MKRREFIKIAAVGVASMSLSGCRSVIDKTAHVQKRKPNFIVILADDLGYSDLSVNGSKNIKTPVLDQMAAEGVRLTDFWTTCSVCSPSRASLLTGRYPQRCGVPYAVGGIYSYTGLQGSEITIAELLKTKGYATATIGKWHLGPITDNSEISRQFKANNQGFDYSYITPGNSGIKGVMNVYENGVEVPGYLDKDGKPLDGPATLKGFNDIRTITDTYTDLAIKFMKENKENPFFIYFAHNRPHFPMIPNPRFAGQSEGGIYGDLVEEVDNSCGRLFKAIKELGLDDNTMVIFASDNGAAATPDNQYGSNAPSRGGKGNTWDGGHRSPAIFRWPGKIAAGQTSDGLTNLMDILPTLCYAADVDLPNDRVIDGANILPLLKEPQTAKSPHDTLYYYSGFNLQAVRKGKWKLHLPRDRSMLCWWEGGGMMEVDKPILFDIKNDKGETNDVADQHPEVVAEILKLAEEVRHELGSSKKAGYDQKDITDYMDDRSGLAHIRNQQNFRELGKRKGIKTEKRRKELEDLTNFYRDKFGQPHVKLELSSSKE